tara:strand:- start:439 stop:681 length:243 start_codon:yes stop_codon:yes gene_type:complete
MNEKELSIKEIEELEENNYPVQWRYNPMDNEIYMYTCHGKRLQKDHIIYRTEIDYCRQQVIGYKGDLIEDLIVGGKIESI